MSLMYTSVNIHKKGDNISCIARWNMGGPFHHPKGIRLNWCSPQCVWIAVIGLETSSNSSCINPERASKTDKYCAPDKACSMSVCLGIGCWSATVALFSLRKSMQTLGLLFR